MVLFNYLTDKENDDFLKFPAYISLLAASCDDKLDKAEKKAAIKLSHTATFACNPMLLDFYREADKVFIKNIEQLDKNLPQEKSKREAAIKLELVKLEKILEKIGEEYSTVMHHSMKIFKEHVSKAHHNVLTDFIFPITMLGFTDYKENNKSL
jgi:hypothetical protein